MPGKNKRAVVLLSGGIDSSTSLAIALSAGMVCTALTFSYGQKHIAELNAARAVADHLGAEKHIIIPLPLGDYVESALTSGHVQVPKEPYSIKKRAESEGIPPTYVPARNTIFLSFALAIAESTGAECICTGVSSVDYSGYPDCRPEFIRAFQNLANVATKSAVEGAPARIMAPLLHLDKSETIKTGMKLGVDYSLTVSCYEPDENARSCGTCDSCRLRRRGFEIAGFEDPADYVT